MTGVMTTAGPPAPPVVPARPRAVPTTPAGADRVFRVLAHASACTVLAVLLLIGVYLGRRSVPAFQAMGWRFFTEAQWSPDGGLFGVGAVLLGTVLVAGVALLMAVPLALGAALFLVDYCPVPLRRPLTSVLDLMAAVPSLVYGLWGLYLLTPRIIPFSRWLTEHLGFVPFFRTDTAVFPSSVFIAGVVVSCMVMPICCAVMREVFSQAPDAEKEGALALGATRWGMVRTVVIPFGRAGVVGGSMLGLGRALGETIAVALIISLTFEPSIQILESGGATISSLIVLRFGESSPLGIAALMAAGVTLFALTLVVNFAAAVVVSRARSGAATEI